MASRGQSCVMFLGLERWVQVKAVLLAGGRGTRMGTLSDECPKPLVKVNGRHLIERPLQRLADIGCHQVIVATGYLGDQFEDALGDGSQFGVQLEYSHESEPRGTGGGIALAAIGRVMAHEDVIVMNADLLSEHDLEAQIDEHRRSSADVTLHVRQVDDPRKYGLVRCDESGRVTSFEEKPDLIEKGAWINAGTYVVRGSVLLDLPKTYPLSWEREVMPRLVTAGVAVQAHRSQAYFRDVGTPEDVQMTEREAR